MDDARLIPLRHHRYSIPPTSGVIRRVISISVASGASHPKGVLAPRALRFPCGEKTNRGKKKRKNRQKERGEKGMKKKERMKNRPN
jgi:hypothetical protein